MSARMAPVLKILPVLATLAADALAFTPAVAMAAGPPAAAPAAKTAPAKPPAHHHHRHHGHGATGCPMHDQASTGAGSGHCMHGAQGMHGGQGMHDGEGMHGQGMHGAPDQKPPAAQSPPK
jgi:hypothetical protein